MKRRRNVTCTDKSTGKKTTTKKTHAISRTGGKHKEKIRTLYKENDAENNHVVGRTRMNEQGQRRKAHALGRVRKKKRKKKVIKKVKLENLRAIVRIG